MDEVTGRLRIEGEDPVTMRAPQAPLFDLENVARDVDPTIGHRLAAFADGEGCFYISAGRKDSFCAFIIQLRHDDKPILERFREGCGGIGTFNYQQSRGGIAPTSFWRVQRKADVVFIRDLFRLYPLWSKKARDFEIWSRAVDFWLTVDAGRRGYDWQPLVELRDELRSVREYREAVA